MKTLTVRDQEIHKAQRHVAEARSKLHTLASLGDALHPDYLAANDELNDALLMLATAFGLAEEFECAFCDGKWDGKGRIVISLHHLTIHSDEDGRVIEEFEYSLGNKRHLVLCPQCAAPLVRKKQVMRRARRPVKLAESETESEETRFEEVEESTEVRAIAEYFNRR
ncbi:MAG: hypothetical protein AB1631_24490 [Acidobacteriota bacterium]